MAYSDCHLHSFFPENLAMSPLIDLKKLDESPIKEEGQDQSGKQHYSYFKLQWMTYQKITLIHVQYAFNCHLFFFTHIDTRTSHSREENGVRVRITSHLSRGKL